MGHDLKTGIEDMVAALSDPLIVMPGGWMDQLPEWVHRQVGMERMLSVMAAAKKGERPDMGTDAEAMIYIASASHLGPMPSEWVEIQLWLGNKVMGKRFPKASGLKVPKELGQDQRRLLDDLKRWIWTRRLKARRLRG